MLYSHMLDTLPIFEVTIDDDDELGVDAVALVNSPAIMVDWVAQRAVRLVQGDRQTLTGPLSIPGQKIYRQDAETGPHYIVYSADTIRKMSERFFAQGNHVRLNVEHEPDRTVEGLVMESWIKQSEIDKSTALGFDLPIGTWFITVKVQDRQFWQQQVKTGKVKGFSLEGYFNHKLLTLSSESHVHMKPAIQSKAGLAHYQSVLRRLKSIAKQNASDRSLQQHIQKLESGNGYDYFCKTLPALHGIMQKYDKKKQSVLEALKRKLGLMDTEEAVEDAVETVVDDLIAALVPAVEDAAEEVAEAESVEQADLALADGRVLVVDESGMAMIDGAVAPAGEHALANGGSVVVDESGMVVQIIDPVEQMQQSLRKHLAQQDARIKALEEAMRRIPAALTKSIKQAPAPAPVPQIRLGNTERIASVESQAEKMRKARELVRQSKKGGRQ